MMASTQTTPPTQTRAKKTRVDKMIEWLRRHEAKLNEYEKVQITFNCAGDMISGDLKQMFHIERA